MLTYKHETHLNLPIANFECTTYIAHVFRDYNLEFILIFVV